MIRVIHLRVVSPPDVTGILMPVLRAEPAVMNLTVLPAAVSHPDGDAVHFDVLHGAANEVIGRLRDLGLEQRGSIVLENVDASISARADRAMARRGRFQQFTPVWAEVEARIELEGAFPPGWFELLVIAGLIGAIGIDTHQLPDPYRWRDGGRATPGAPRHLATGGEPDYSGVTALSCRKSGG